MWTCCRLGPLCRVAALIAVLAVVSLLAFQPAPAREARQPRLAVLVVFDQLRGDYLTRWDDLFGPDGFHRLEGEGAWFQNCHYPYAATVTGVGHASLLTGCGPTRHGIVGNEWYDRAAGEEVYCAGLARYERVPPLPPAAGTPKLRIAGTPDRLLAPSLGDVLKEATGGRARVVSLSFKDRSAVLPGGRRADACYWLDAATGQFVTSTYYRDRLHPWVAAFNAARPADRWFGQPWDRLRPELDYAAHTGTPDDLPGEGKGTAQGRTFPHPMNGGKDTLGKDYYAALYNSPFGNELLLDLVKRAVDAEQLGADEVPDLLCVSFSCNDPIGHIWGPDSHEVLDVTLRTDLIVKDLLGYLDARVGKGRYVLALTADHGVCPLPEVAHARGLEAGRVLRPLLVRGAEAHLSETFGAPDDLRTRWLAHVSDEWIYLNHTLLAARGLEPARVEEALARWLNAQAGIQTTYTRSQLLKGVGGDPLGQKVLRSFHPQRCGDLMVIGKPYHLITTYLTGTGHGTPHPYDAHVPLLVFGPGIHGGARSDPVTPQAIAAIFAHALDVPLPAAAEAPVPPGLFERP